MKYLVEATKKYKNEAIEDQELQEIPEAGKRWETNHERANLLESNGFVKIIKKLEEQAINPTTEIKPANEDIKKLKKLKKSELIAIAENKGLIADESMTKDVIIDLIMN